MTSVSIKHTISPHDEKSTKYTGCCKPTLSVVLISDHNGADIFEVEGHYSNVPISFVVLQCCSANKLAV